MCIVLAKYFPETGWVGIKNRDRNYRPLVDVKLTKKDGAEFLCFWDEKTFYSEGINQYGIAILSAALATKEDEKAGKGASSRKKLPRCHHGKAIRHALEENTLEDAVQAAIDGTLIGNTIFFTQDRCIIMESTHDAKGEFVHCEHEISKDKVALRTNHGIWLKDAGYQWNSSDEKETMSRISSESRFAVTKMLSKRAQNKDELIDCTLFHAGVNPQLNPCRLDDSKDALRTTGQIVICPKEMTMWFRPIWCDITFDYAKLNTEESKLFFELLSLGPVIRK
jgi:hypothetical protein